MANSAPSMKVLTLYKSLLRESQKFTSYNFRKYALRKIRDDFREKRTLTDPQRVKEEISFGEKSLESLRRQVIVGHLYSSDKLVIENKS